MRVFWTGLFCLAFSTPGQALPVPAPPDDFAGSQYVDGKGCVYLREGSDWTLSLDKAGAAICGFPPTLSSRRTDPDLDRVLPPEHAEVAETAESLLMRQLSSGLRQGEFLADPLPPQERRTPDLPERPTAMQKDLVQIAAHQSALRNALKGAGQSGSKLCDLLGYVPDNNRAPILGGDVTEGLCPGMRAPLPEERITTGASPERSMQVANDQPKMGREGRTDEVTRTTPRPSTAVSGASPEPKQPPSALTLAKPSKSQAAAAGGASVVARKDRPAKPSAPQGVEMIPASARYVQVGTYLDDDNAVLTIRRLSQLGYPVVQQRVPVTNGTSRVIMAGPFKDRQSLIAALNRLRGNGYAKAIAR